jgi:hypothetical protein
MCGCTFQPPRGHRQAVKARKNKITKAKLVPGSGAESLVFKAANAKIED